MMGATDPSLRNSYADVMASIRQLIAAGGFRPGLKLPAERDLVERFHCARMTVRRALQELEREGLLERRHGSGTYVADLRPISNVLEIKDICEEIVARGHRHSCELLLREKRRASGVIATALAIARGAPVFHCEVLHFENGLPIQFEDRYVNADLLPDFMTLDLNASTVSSHLFDRAPLTGAEQVIEAVNADPAMARQLGVEAGAALLRVSRRTTSRDRVASIARLYHPGASFQLIGAFSVKP